MSTPLETRLIRYDLALLCWAVLYPFLMPDFWVLNIGAPSLFFGLVALSLSFLAGYGGMVSLAQMTVAGVAGYALALTSVNAEAMGVPLPWPLAVAFAVLVAVLFSIFVGFLAARTEGIYLLMITLAIGMGFFFLVQQNDTVFNAFNGLQGVAVPQLFERPIRSEAQLFYFICLGVAATFYAGIRYLVATPAGLALQAVRDDPRKAAALGYSVLAIKVAAFAAAGVPAALGGVLMVWYNQRISPGSVDLGGITAILIMAVVGGLRHPAGAFIGAVLYVLLQNFAGTIVGADRFNLLIGSIFLAIVLFSPDGLLGIARRLQAAMQRRRAA
ncbi:ABC transporter ATP-binding protein [Bordetella genomosp. 5]|uniref:branched-chain amino acid ABC transporter permease n=1 Tax=Bordetella genomosp. 5 TaxID=1395608 RepID=UPI000B9EC161|nr:branched-chain amino acid ABC transporter permease [Bordetella genomosp. 5]OZI47644.1 ABC transporter ATP-binding protein [Bordetella genomosp. 5]